MTTNHQTSIASLAKKRRTYNAEFKEQMDQACKAPDVSITSVALQLCDRSRTQEKDEANWA